MCMGMVRGTLSFGFCYVQHACVYGQSNDSYTVHDSYNCNCFRVQTHELFAQARSACSLNHDATSAIAAIYCNDMKAEGLHLTVCGQLNTYPVPK